jgi:molybdopterin biosynthesis enzyme MoaB
MVRTAPTAEDSLAAILARSKLGIAMAAPIITAAGSNDALEVASEIALSSP